MSGGANKCLAIGLAAATGLGALFVEENFAAWTLDRLVSEADARIGRPLTPLSYAGVARRTTRRAVRPYAYTPACVQVVDAYGRIVTRCY
jgi:hypothetical protein